MIIKALIACIVSLGVLYIFKFILLEHLKTLTQKTETHADDLLFKIVSSLGFAFYIVISLYIGFVFLNTTQTLSILADSILFIVLLYHGVRIIEIIIHHSTKSYIGDIEHEKTASSFLILVARIILWTIGVLFILQNAGVNITSLLAGLGIGGIAIAFALQNVLEDLFSSFAIFFDKPFEIGDTIKIGEHIGSVEKIGIKTTRLRSLEGEEIIVANRELTNATLHNYKRLNERRRVFTFGVSYDTNEKLLEEIPKMIEQIITTIPLARFGRAHFIDFGESSLDFEVAYHIESDDYNKALDIQQEINIRLKTELEKRKIAIPYPTRVVRLEK